jgi:hypothetical protein
MNSVDFPPFPALGAKGPQACEAVRFYLAIIDELPFEQIHVLSEHVQNCKDCSAEFRLLQRATRLIATLPASAPSAHIDEAVLAAIKKRGEASYASVQLHAKKQGAGDLLVRRAQMSKPASRRWTGTLGLVAALLLLGLAGIFLHGLIVPANNAQAFQLPNSLSWNGYVLHYTQTKTDTQGKSYQVEVYQDLGTNQMHIESSIQDQFDVVVITDSETMLGEDMMHHVAQMGSGVEIWAVDGSMFDLSQLRQDLVAHHMTYLGKESFQGQEVYLVRADDDQVLLLDMNYLPVNVLQNFTDPGTGTPLYKTFTLMRSAQVSDSMWDMQVPPDFRMGQLPDKS